MVCKIYVYVPLQAAGTMVNLIGVHLDKATKRKRSKRFDEKILYIRVFVDILIVEFML